MKHFTKLFATLILLFLFFADAFSQNSPIVSYRFVPGQFGRDSTYFTYNAQDKLTEKTVAIYDANAGTWNKSTKTSYIIDGNGNTVSSLEFKWSNNAWVQSKKTTNTYNGNKLDVSLIETYKSGNWETLIEQRFTYKQDGKIDSVYNSTIKNGALELTSTIDYIYTTQGDLAEKNIARWSSANSQWETTAKWVYLYGFDGKLVKEEEDNFIAGQWVHIHHYKYIYDNNGVLRFKDHLNSANNALFDREGYKYKGEATFMNVNEIDNVNEVTFFPNPCTNTAKLVWETNGTYSIAIKDVSGKTFKFYENISANTIDINTSSFKQGIYFYTIQNTKTGWQKTNKFIVAK